MTCVVGAPMVGGPCIVHGVVEAVAPAAAGSSMLPMVIGLGIVLVVMEYQKEKGKVNDGISQETLPSEND